MGQLPELLRQKILPLGHDGGRGHIGAVFQSHGVVRRVGHDDRGPFRVLHHAAAAHLPLQTAHPGFDGRIAFAFLVFLQNLLLAHAQLALQPLPFREIVDAGPAQQYQRARPRQLKEVREHEHGQRRRVQPGQPKDLRPIPHHQGHRQIGHHGKRHQRLAQMRQRRYGDQALDLATRAEAFDFGLERRRGEDHSPLRQRAGQSHYPGRPGDHEGRTQHQPGRRRESCRP